ncbi:MAG: S-layer family protein [Cyanosarcina radialis HA8281-LM2]|jgi:filamentous hemagglutinin family protein|nr:S-layer family protein [Cyanosarcina radialis HA8281-LM2]
MKTQVWMQVTIAIALSSNCAAQVVPDGTLPAGERSQVRGNFDFQIDGGAVRGSNLFHSFQRFSIPTGSSVVFNNSLTIDNIINRVTGSNISNIDGLIRANGNANVFLINPNGIVFGQNARLDIGGSFLASTADGVAFGNGFTFSATDPQAPPLLTINVPVGLQYGSNPGAIEVRGASLQVPDGQTLTIAGGKVNLEGGKLIALGGRVELLGIGSPGEVGLTQRGPEWRLTVPESLTRADIAIVNNAIVDVRAGGGGSIGITARNFTGRGFGTQVRSGIAPGFGTAGARAGDIDINATEAVNLDEMFLSNRVESGGTGNAGNINIATGSLSLTNGGAISASTFGRGDGGNITITARDTVSFDGESSDGFSSGAFSAIAQEGIGRGGNIRIDTGSLFLTNGAQVTTITLDRGDGGNININTGSLSLTNGAQVDTSTFGRGDGGKIDITARDTVSFDGTFSGAISEVGPEAIGRGGDISINTGSLFLTNGAQVTTITLGRGDAGNIDITARDTVSFDGSNEVFSGAVSVTFSIFGTATGRGGDIEIDAGSLFLTNGGRVDARSLSRGDAGNITITARDTVSFDGVGSNGFASGAFSNTDNDVSSTIVGRGGDITINTGSLYLTNGARVDTSTSGRGFAGNIKITATDAVFFDGTSSDGLPSGAFSSVASRTVGQGGKITVNTGLFSITNGAELSTSSEGQGNAGNIEANARQLRLDMKGSIQAQTASGQGGNITLNVRDYLLLRRGSFISTTAGTAQSGGDGGNITFNGNFIVAVPEENSDISANAFTGQGGRVEINAQGIFGIQSRPEPTRFSDITASSEFGISGTVTIDTPDLDPSRGLESLPTGLVDPDSLIANSCLIRSSRQGSFTIAGSGGLAAQPDDLGNSSFPTYELVPDANTSNAQPSSAEIVEPDGIYRLPNGELVLGRSCH